MFICSQVGYLGKEHKRIGCSNAPATLSSSLLKKDEEKKAVVVVSDRQDLEEPELEKHRLSTESKMALDEAAWIREELDRNVELLNLVRRVDCAKNRHAALEKARTENPVFRDWIDRVMLHLGLCEKQQNQIVFVGYS